MKYLSIVFVVAALAALSPKPFPGGSQGIGFDDLGFAPTLREVMVPGGSTGKLALIDPDSQNIEIIGGFSERAGYSGGHGEGITSSDAGHGLIYVTDRSSRLLDIVDPNTKKIIASTRWPQNSITCGLSLKPRRCGLRSRGLNASRYFR